MTIGSVQFRDLGTYTTSLDFHEDPRLTRLPYNPGTYGKSDTNTGKVLDFYSQYDKMRYTQNEPGRK